MLNFGLLIISSFIALIVIIILTVITDGAFLLGLFYMNSKIVQFFNDHDDVVKNWGFGITLLQVLSSPLFVFYLWKHFL
jgi:hypothetical protein